eukprot:TRINITY_DN30142_c0_g1_i1.p1 TRINITY_DN30142_c0_g1~~TRINITY_DN30142_c0_g1_i1.p1  ORF type:complete len:517 (+),score=62.90 TRINITY_DN30142_c0_g1_i1:97-1647(+)
MKRWVRATWLYIVAHAVTAQRIDACVNRSRGERCSWAGAFNSVHHGVCTSIGPVNRSVIACLAVLVQHRPQAPQSAPDPSCRHGLLHSRGRVCCPSQCGSSCTDDAVSPGYDNAENQLQDDAAGSGSGLPVSQIPGPQIVCTVDAILRASPSCRESGAPCVMPATQGMPPTGFASLESTALASSSAGSGLPSGSDAGQVGEPEETQVLAAPKALSIAGIEFTPELGEPLLISCVASLMMLCYCCFCFKLLSCCVRRYRSKRPSSPQGAGSVRPRRSDKVRRRKRRKRRHSSDEGEVVSPNVETATASCRDPYDDSHLFVEIETPMPIIDVWNKYGGPELSMPPDAKTNAAIYDDTSIVSRSTRRLSNQAALSVSSANGVSGVCSAMPDSEVPSSSGAAHLESDRGAVTSEFALKGASRWQRPQPSPLDLDNVGLSASTAASNATELPALDRVLGLLGTLKAGDELLGSVAATCPSFSEAAMASAAARDAKFDTLDGELAASLTDERHAGVILPAGN